MPSDSSAQPNSRGLRISVNHHQRAMQDRLPRFRQKKRQVLPVPNEIGRLDSPTPVWSHFRVNEILIQLWEFADAPEHLKCLIPLAYAGGWLAYIRPGGGEDPVVELLTARWCASGFSLTRFELGDGSIVLAGQHLPGPAPTLPVSPSPPLNLPPLN